MTQEQQSKLIDRIYLLKSLAEIKLGDGIDYTIFEIIQQMVNIIEWR